MGNLPLRCSPCLKRPVSLTMQPASREQLPNNFRGEVARADGSTLPVCMQRAAAQIVANTSVRPSDLGAQDDNLLGTNSSS
jgi:hypothetical protein